MSAELSTSWSDASAMQGVTWLDRPPIYTVGLILPDTEPPLNGYIRLRRDPELHIPLFGPYIKYTQEDVEYLDKYIHAKNDSNRLVALDSMMARVNLKTLGCSLDTTDPAEINERFPQSIKQLLKDRKIHTVMGSSDQTLYSYALELWNESSYSKDDPPKVDPEIRVAEYINRLRDTMTIKPYNFEKWKKNASADFAAVSFFPMI